MSIQKSTGSGGSSVEEISNLSSVQSTILNTNASIQLTVDGFGFFKDPKSNAREVVRRYTWRNLENGTVAQVISYGATVVSMKTPDRCGSVEDIVCGFDDMEGYRQPRNPYFGATVGRVCNRIGHGEFVLNGQRIEVTKNKFGKHTLHGGLIGFDKVNWTSHVQGNKVIMCHVSPDGHEGFPGTVLATVTFELLPDSFTFEFQATSTKPTPVNLTNHSYFNLAGHGTGYSELYKHIVTINADKITETDEDSIPTGKFTCVGDTLFDLRIPRVLGMMMARIPKQGYDDNFCVSQGTKQGLTFVARVLHPDTGRTLEVYSDQPGVQFYTSNFMPDPLGIINPVDVTTRYSIASSDDQKIPENEGALIGKKGAKYLKHGAFCLETQKFPDSVNHSNFPTTILNPGETYHHVVVYKFGVQSESSTQCKNA